MAGRPFIIISPGRSGSSYTAGKFAHAGVFGGIMRKGDQCNPDGYFENIALHSDLREWYGRKWMRGDFPEEKPGWNKHVINKLYAEGWTGGAWFFKCGAFYWKAFESFEPVYVKVWRDRDKILESFTNTGILSTLYTPQEIEILVDRQLEAMKEIPGLDVKIG